LGCPVVRARVDVVAVIACCPWLRHSEFFPA
jgi:hypothetical protein